MNKKWEKKTLAPASDADPYDFIYGSGNSPYEYGSKENIMISISPQNPSSAKKYLWHYKNKIKNTHISKLISIFCHCMFLPFYQICRGSGSGFVSLHPTFIIYRYVSGTTDPDPNHWPRPPDLVWKTWWRGPPGGWAGQPGPRSCSSAGGGGYLNNRFTTVFQSNDILRVPTYSDHPDKFRIQILAIITSYSAYSFR